MKPGDKLWFVPSHRMGGEPREETVTKVGLWVHTTAGHKFKTHEMCVRYGKYYRSIDDYAADERRRWAWTRLIKLLTRLQWCCPNNVTAEDIYDAALRLRLNILDDEGKRT
jgi:hypothetical protein